MADGELPGLGLRERKKLRTRAAIQKEALRLFAAQGFSETTVEQIAEAAEVSPSTFFNYFPTKEDAVLIDDLDDRLLAAFRAAPASVGPLAALRSAMHSVFGAMSGSDAELMQARLSLVARDEELRAALLGRFSGFVDEAAGLLAERVGRPASDFAVRNVAGALMGVFLATLLAAASDARADWPVLIDRAMEHLEAGLPL